jgi:hypothetical protein
MSSRDDAVHGMRKSFILLFMAAFAGDLPQPADLDKSSKNNKLAIGTCGSG